MAWAWTSLVVLLGVIGIVESEINKDEENSIRTNDVSGFNCKDKPRMSRFPYPNNCFKFIYCVSGSPYPGQCFPEGARFNVRTGRCDLPRGEKCGSDKESLDVQKPAIPTAPPTHSTTTTTTSATSTLPTTTTTNKPPKLSDHFDFSFACDRCGLYPNPKGNCSSFIQCVGGKEVLKMCHGGQLFDSESEECHPPEDSPKCWAEPDSGPFQTQPKPPSYCPPHPYNSTLGKCGCAYCGVDKQSIIETTHSTTPANNVVVSVPQPSILSSPNLTNFGEWGPWEECPRGTFITGINAWRRLLQVGSRTDHAGIVSIGLQCSSPDGSMNHVLQSVARGAPNDGFPTFYNCFGGSSAVGFQLNSQPLQGPGGDNIGTDNVQLICSCGAPVHKPYEVIPGPQSGNRGEWTGMQICGARTAICGIQTQMAQYKEGVVGSYDNTGLNSVRMKCCPVEQEQERCIPKESLKLIRTCINDKGIYPRRCDFQYSTGISYNHEEAPGMRSINFYRSLGYTLEGYREGEEVGRILKKRFEENEMAGILGKEYSWKMDGSEALMDQVLWKIDNGTTWMDQKIYLKVNTSVELFQVVGLCGHYFVRTNRFMRKVTDLRSMDRTAEYFEIF